MRVMKPGTLTAPDRRRCIASSRGSVRTVAGETIVRSKPATFLTLGVHFQTVLALARWLPKPPHALLRRSAPAFFAEEVNLNLMTRHKLGAVIASITASPEAVRLDSRVETIRQRGWPTIHSGLAATDWTT